MLDREIKWEWLEDLVKRMFALQIQSNDPITLMIDSPGGSTLSALRLCDIITHVLTAPVYAVVVGECHSAATYVLLHCAKRSGLPYSGYVIHSGKFNDLSIQIGNTTQANLEQLLEEGKKHRETDIALYSDKLKKTRPEVEALINRGDQDFNSRLSAREALEIGLIEEIIEGKLGIFSS